MANQEKIDQLLESRTPENNLLAIQLMKGLQGKSFQEAFHCLKLLKTSHWTYEILTPRIRVLYRLSHSNFWYYYIDRLLYYRGILLADFGDRGKGEVQIYCKKQTVYNLPMEEMEALVAEDRLAILPEVEKLFLRED